MKTEEYQKAASRTICPQNDITNKEVIQMLHCVVGMMGELGELASCLEKQRYTHLTHRKNAHCKVVIPATLKCVGCLVRYPHSLSNLRGKNHVIQ